MADGSSVRRTLEALRELVHQEIARHPSGHLGIGPVRRLELDLSVPLRPVGPDAGDLDSVREAIRRGVDELLLRRAILRPGRVWCLRCASSDCEHAAIEDPRTVFAGWTPSGIPRFEELGQVLLERRHPRVDRLFSGSPEVIATVVPGRDLTAGLLPAFQEPDEVRVHGQVIAGWYRVPAPEGNGTHSLATTIQIVSSPAQSPMRSNI